MVTGVRDIDIASGVHGDAVGAIQLSASGWAVVATETTIGPISRHRGDHAARDLADAVVGCDVKVAGGVHGHVVCSQPGAGGWTVVAAETGHPTSSRHRGDHAARDLADARVTVVC